MATIAPPTNSLPNPAGLDNAVTKAFGGDDPTQQPPVKKDPYADDKALVEQFEKFHDECFGTSGASRLAQERTWWRNILYVLGRQWIYYDRENRVWRDKRMAKWIPRPVTNLAVETVDAVMAIFQAVTLGIVVRPVGNDPKNVTTAETADRLEPAIHESHDMKSVRRRSDWWLAVTGNVFWYSWWDPHDERSMRQIPLEACVQCGTVSAPDQVQDAGGLCPECGAFQFNDAVDENGEPLTEPGSDGGGRTDVKSPLEVGVPCGYDNFDEIPGLVCLKWYTKHWFERYHPEMLKGDQKLEFEKMTSERSLQMLKAINNQTDIGLSPFAGSGGEQADVEGITVAEQWLKPCAAYPKGLVARFLSSGGKWRVFRDKSEGLPGEIPHRDVRGNKLWPWIHIGYDFVGGRMWAEAILNRIIQKIDQINQLDSLIQLSVQRTANPVWLEPKGAEVQKFTGEPGLVVQYNPLIAGGNAKPERIEGSNIPAYLFQYREQLKADIEELAGTYDILKGTKPAGVEAFAAMQLLVERSQSRFGSVLEARGQAYAKWFRIAIELERQHGPQQRTMAVLGPNMAWTYETFQNADLQGDIEILIEDGSQTPKTNLGERAAIEHLNQLQILTVQSPDTQYEILRSFGQTKLVPQLDSAVKSALQEQEAFEKWALTASVVPPTTPFEPDQADPTGATPAIDPMTGQPMPAQPNWATPPPGTRMIWHDDAVHLSEHTKWLNGDKMRTLMEQNPQLIPVCEWLVEQHMMALAPPPMAGAPGDPNAPPQEPGGAGRGMANSNQNAGQLPMGV